MTMVDYRGPAYQLPHRKPVATPHTSIGSPGLQRIVPDSQWTNSPSSTMQSASGPNMPFIGQHSRTRTSSSSVFPPVSQPQHTYHSQMNQYNSTRRTLSNATNSTSTTGTSGGMAPLRKGTNVSISIRRSSSSRSAGGSPGGYVALMRKQKATVWCDRSQHEDPRLLAQQKAAKLRAAMEVIGAGSGTSGKANSANSGSLGANSVRKIRHHHAKNNPGYSPATLVGVGGVPMRLSASEVGDEEDSDVEGDSQYSYHRRTGSGRSSLHSAHRRPVGAGLHTIHPTLSMTSANSFGKAETPPSGGSDSPSHELAELAELETPVPGKNINLKGRDYFATGTGLSGSSGGSSRENSFGNVGQLNPMHGKPPALVREKSTKNPDELRRRGSVDDRTMTMSTGRLFVANPDLSD